MVLSAVSASAVLAGPPAKTSPAIANADVYRPSERGDDPAPQLRARFTDGSTVLIPSRPWAFAGSFGTLAQVDFTEVHKILHGGALGWIAQYGRCDGHDPCPAIFVLWRDGKIVWTTAPTRLAVTAWGPVQGDIALESSRPDQSGPQSYELLRLSDGGLLKTHNLSEHPPPA